MFKMQSPKLDSILVLVEKYKYNVLKCKSDDLITLVKFLRTPFENFPLINFNTGKLFLILIMKIEYHLYIDLK